MSAINWEHRYAYKITEWGDCLVSFRAVKIISDDPELLYEYFDDAGHQEFVTDFDKAETVLHGSIKWDGCSNWDYHTSTCMRHFCGRSDAADLGRLIEHFYDIAATLPAWDAELGA